MIDNLNNLKENLYNMIKDNYINNNDINNISNLKFTDIENLDFNNSYKNKVLLSIYLNPYLLCDDKIVTECDIDIDSFSNLLIKRYNEELQEYENRLKDGLITYQEYNNNITILHNIYFKNSIVGMRLENINKDKIKKKERKWFDVKIYK